MSVNRRLVYIAVQSLGSKPYTLPSSLTMQFFIGCG